MNSIVNKYFEYLSMFHLSNILMLVAIGYGSMVSMYTISSSDTLPEIRNIKRIVWEGIKKSLIIAFYTIFLSYLFHHAKIHYLNGKGPLFVICAILFALVWLILIGGLLNRYFHNGAFFKAFNLVEIFRLFTSYDKVTFVQIIIFVIISQLFVVTVFVNFHKGFSLVELAYSVLTFFLAPFLFIATTACWVAC